MSRFWENKQPLLIEGMMPERALLRLKRAGIPVYDAKKCEKNQILFYVNRKDSEKVFAIYPKTWYNKAERGGYEVSSLGEKGVFVRLKKLEKRPE